MLVPQSDIAEPNLVSGMAELGVRARFVAAYRTVGIPVAESVRADVASGRFTAILVSSGSVAGQIAAQLAPLPDGSWSRASARARPTTHARRASTWTSSPSSARRKSLVDALLEHVHRVPSER